MVIQIDRESPGITRSGSMLPAHGDVTVPGTSLPLYCSAPNRWKMPQLKALYDRWHQHGLEIIGVGRNGNATIVRKVCIQEGLTWPQILVPEDKESRELWQEACGIEEGLGQKGKSGVLKSKASRAAFLGEASHRIRFVYTPRPSSGLNQIEIWFSTLVRKLLRRSSFSSLENLEERVLGFIDYFNRTMAKPIDWLYSPRPLHREASSG